MHALWHCQGKLEILTTEMDILPKIQKCTLSIQMYNQYYPNKCWKYFQEKKKWNPCHNGNKCLQVPLWVSWSFANKYVLGLKNCSFSGWWFFSCICLELKPFADTQSLLAMLLGQQSGDRKAADHWAEPFIPWPLCRRVSSFHLLVEGAPSAAVSVVTTQQSQHAIQHLFSLSVDMSWAYKDD